VSLSAAVCLAACAYMLGALTCAALLACVAAVEAAYYRRRGGRPP
jgi:hypothetical protein